jgi:hypothetical protein
MAKILGLPFDDYVKKQIEVRQTKLSKTQKAPEDLVVFNSNTSWVRLSSAVKVEPGRAKTLADKLEINVNLIQENALARNLVLWGGISSFSTGSDGAILDPLKGGIGYGINNAYGFLSNSAQGLQPLPGIENISCNYKNNGSLKQAQVKLKCFTRSQFEALEAIYLRLGYTVVLEWGNTAFFDNSNQSILMSKHSIPDILFGKSGNVAPETIQSKLENNKISTGGNYDGMLAKVSNFSWNIQEDLSYAITLDLISVGDIIDSLKANIGGTPGQGDLLTKVEVSGSIQNLVSIQLNKNASRINAFLNDLYVEVFKDALGSWQVSGETQAEIANANKAVDDVSSGEPKKTQDVYLATLNEFKKYAQLWREAKAIYKLGSLDYTGNNFQSNSASTPEQQKRYFDILKELGILPASAAVSFSNEDEETDGVVKYEGCLNTIEKFIKDTKPGSTQFNKLQKNQSQAKISIINALEYGRLGPENDYEWIEGSKYEDGTGDYEFTNIIEIKFGIDG